MSEDDLLGVRNFGRKSLDELRDRLQERDLLENSRLAATSTSGVAVSDEEEEDEEVEEDDEASVEELMQPTGVATVAAPEPQLAQPPPSPVEEEDLEDFTRSPSARAVRTAPRPVRPPPVVTDEDEEVPEYTFDFSDEDINEEEEEEEEQPRRGGRRRR